MKIAKIDYTTIIKLPRNPEILHTSNLILTNPKVRTAYNPCGKCSVFFFCSKFPLIDVVLEVGFMAIILILFFFLCFLFHVIEIYDFGQNKNLPCKYLWPKNGWTDGLFEHNILLTLVWTWANKVLFFVVN